MQRCAIVLVALLACSCRASVPPPRSLPRPTRSAVGAPLTAPPTLVAAQPPDALAVVTAALSNLAPVDAAVAPWMPSQVLGAVLRASGEFPLPGAPTGHDGDVTWTLLLPASASPSAAATACATLVADPHLACASDRVEHVGRLRDRIVAAWREPSSPRIISRYQPMRALARLARGVCLVSAQETAHTLDLTVRANDTAALGETLALLTVSPGLRALITVRIEPQGEALLATLSWPFDRATVSDLGDDAWPARCAGALDLGASLAPGTVPVARSFIAGGRATGAVLTAGRTAWVVTVGDRVARATVRAVDASGVTLQRPGAGRPLRLRWRP